MTKKVSARTSAFNRFALGDLLNKLMSENGVPRYFTSPHCVTSNSAPTGENLYAPTLW